MVWWRDDDGWDMGQDDGIGDEEMCMLLMVRIY